ncbi:MAG: TlpA family protein disulfide reductase [Actinobacteria bacterium]|nr:TlpA family protein disulfide reductase [Actinomycetota bacterium]MBW3651584.1 TlpA family protein disulfide reductase [Actinomycetota bacterium]
MTTATSAPATVPAEGGGPAALPLAPRRRVAPWVALALAVVLLGLVAVLATREPAQNTLAQSPLLGKPAPEVIGTGLDGSTLRLSQFRGRYVVLNFFATWCVPCQQEHDDLLRFSERHRSAGDAVVLAVIFDDEPDRVRQFFERRGGDWPVLADPSGKVSLDFGVRGPPESYLIDPNGFVRSKIVGQVDDAGLESLIRAAESAS